MSNVKNEWNVIIGGFPDYQLFSIAELKKWTYDIFTCRWWKYKKLESEAAGLRN